MAKRPITAARTVKDIDYRALAAFRFALRRYLAFAEGAATRAGLLPQQYQALLVIKAAAPDHKPTVGLVAAQLLVAPHTALELVRRLEAADYLTVVSDPFDRRRRLLTLTPTSERVLARLGAVHLRELRELGPELANLLARRLRREAHSEGTKIRQDNSNRNRGALPGIPILCLCAEHCHG